MADTPALIVSQRFISVGATRKITLVLKQPYQAPLYLDLVTLIENTALGPPSGTIIKGIDGTHGGSSSIQLSTADITHILAFVAQVHTNLTVTITYDDTVNPPVALGVSVGATL